MHETCEEHDPILFTKSQLIIVHNVLHMMEYHVTVDFFGSDPSNVEDYDTILILTTR